MTDAGSNRGNGSSSNMRSTGATSVAGHELPNHPQPAAITVEAVSKTTGTSWR